MMRVIVHGAGGGGGDSEQIPSIACCCEHGSGLIGPAYAVGHRGAAASVFVRIIMTTDLSEARWRAGPIHLHCARA